MIYRIRLFTLAAITGILLTACGGDDASSTNNTVQAVANPTYHNDIAPLLYEHCVKCHKVGGIAPFSLLQTENGIQAAQDNANSMNADIQNQTMPPWLADNSGQCNTFDHARWMVDGERQTFANWVSTGKPLGDEPASPPIENPFETLDRVDATVAMANAYTPTGDAGHPNDDYRCFVLNAPSTTDMLLTDFEVKPGNDQLVHHVILFDLTSADMEQAALAQDAADPLVPGYTCFGDANVPGFDPTFIAGWAPGTTVTHYPAGTGVKLVANRKMIMQVHYNLAAEPIVPTDQTTIDLKLTALDGAITEAIIFPVLDKTFSIPPNTTGSDATVVHTELVPALFPTVNIWGLFPHMHTYGKSISVSKIAKTSSSETCMVDVPRWNFEWQQFFFFDQKTGPITVGPGDSVKLTCQFDTTGAPGNVVWGEGTSDEMCISFLYATRK